jgi:hypothetical protein
MLSAIFSRELMLDEPFIVWSYAHLVRESADALSQRFLVLMNYIQTPKKKEPERLSGNTAQRTPDGFVRYCLHYMFS